MEAATDITVTEQRWLTALAQGVTMVELGAAEAYSERHLRRMLTDVYRRLGADCRIQALIRATELGLLDGSSRTEHASRPDTPE